MHRKNLEAAVETAARECELSFFTGHEHRINESLARTPALWLAPLEAVGSQGIREGIRTYAIRMTIIEMPDRESAANPEQVWRRMEDKASNVCHILGEAECVKSLSDIKFAAATASVTNRGEISMAITMKVQVPFTTI